MILKKKKIIDEHMEESKKDILLSRIGRIFALIFYSIFYFLVEWLSKHTIKINGTLIAGILSGSTLTLTITKGIYTSLHQYQKKNHLFDRLEYMEHLLDTCNQVIDESKSKEENVQLFFDQINQKKKWTITRKKGK